MDNKLYKMNSTYIKIWTSNLLMTFYVLIPVLNKSGAQFGQ